MAYPNAAAIARRRAVGARARRRRRRCPTLPTTPGNHTDGVTVADLIAKLNGDQRRPSGTEAAPARTRTHRRRHRRPRRTEIIDAVPPHARHEPTRRAGLRRGHRQPGHRDHPRHRCRPPICRIWRWSTGTAGCRRHTSARGHRAPISVTRIGDGASRWLPARAIAAVIAVLALALTGGAWQWQSAKNNMLNRISALDPDSRDIVDPNAQFGDENFLIVGVDSRMRRKRRHGRGHHRGGGRCPVGHRDAGEHPRQPRTRCGRVVSARPGHRADAVRAVESGDRRVRTDLRPRVADATVADEVYTEYKLNSAYAVGGPKCLVKVIQKLSGLSVNRFMAVDFAGFSKMVDALGGVEVCSTTPLEDYELGTVLPNAGRQMVDGHTALQYVRARQVDDRDQRRLRPDQTSAAVPVLAVALDDLQGSVLLAVQAQQRRQHVHQRQLCRQHGHQGPRHPWPVDSGHRRGPDHLPDRAHHGIHGRVRQRASSRGRQPGASSTRSSTTIRCPRRRTPTTPRCPAPPRVALRHRSQDAAPATELVDAITTNPQTSPCRCRTRPARTGSGRPPPANSRRTASTSSRPTTTPARWTRRRCSSRPATNRPRRPSPRRSPTRPSNGPPAWVTSCRWCSAPTSTR